MVNNTISSHPNNEEQEIDLLKILEILRRNFLWFVIFGLFGASLAFIFYKYQGTKYKISSTLLVEEEGNNFRMDAMFNDMSPMGGGKVELNKHISILKSFRLNQQVERNLKLDIAIFEKDWIRKQELYQNNPFSIKKYDYFSDMESVSIVIQKIDSLNYYYRTDEILTNTNSIILEGNGQFGKKLKTDHFECYIYENKGIEWNSQKKYFFQFLNKDKVTLNYQSRLNIEEQYKQGQMLTISLEGTVPLKDIAYINELISVYSNYNLEKKNRISTSTIKFIDDQLSGISESLRTTSDNFAEYKSNNDAVNLDKRAEVAIESFQNLDAQRRQAKLRLDYYEEINRYLEESDDLKNIMSPSLVGINDINLNGIIIQLSELYSTYETLSYGMNKKNPRLRKIENDMKATRNRLKENIFNLQRNTKREVKNIEEELSKMERKMATLPKTEQRMTTLKRDYTLNNDLFTFLQEKRAEAAVLKASSLSDLEVIDEAQFSTAALAGLGIIQLLIIGAFLGACIPAGIILLRHILHTTIEDIQELESLTTLPILTSIAHCPYKIPNPITAHPRSGFTESLRTIRTKLTYLIVNKGPFVLAIHSIIPGEGKSFSSQNIATIFSLNKKRVLLVGLDLRKPQLHNYMDLKVLEGGISTFLIGKDSFQDITQPSGIDNLEVALAGPIPPNPAELLESDMLEVFIKEAKKNYDIIVLDNAPLSLVTDGFISGSHADVNLVIVRQDVSHRDQLKYINEVSEQKMLKRITILPNDFKMSHQYSYKYDFKSKGYYEECEKRRKRSLFNRDKKQRQ